MKSLFGFIILVSLIFAGYYYDQSQKGNEIIIADYVILEANPEKQAQRQAELEREEGSFINDRANNFIENTEAESAFQTSVERAGSNE